MSYIKYTYTSPITRSFLQNNERNLGVVERKIPREIYKKNQVVVIKGISNAGIWCSGDGQLSGRGAASRLQNGEQALKSGSDP